MRAAQNPRYASQKEKKKHKHTVAMTLGARPPGKAYGSTFLPGAHRPSLHNRFPTMYYNMLRLPTAPTPRVHAFPHLPALIGDVLCGFWVLLGPARCARFHDRSEPSARKANEKKEALKWVYSHTEGIKIGPQLGRREASRGERHPPIWAGRGYAGRAGMFGKLRDGAVLHRRFALRWLTMASAKPAGCVVSAIGW